MPQKYRVKLSDGREFDVETEGGPPSESDILSNLEPKAAPAARQPSGAIARFADSAVQNNPITTGLDFLGQMLKNPRAAGAAIVDPSVARIERGNQAVQQGRPAAALGQYAAAVPLIGPYIADNIERAQGGDVAGALGALSWLASPAVMKGARMLAPESSALSRSAPLLRANLTTPEAASVAFGESHGIPMDAATKTGSRVALALQKRAANSMGGEATAANLITKQAEGLTRVGGELADRVRPGAVTPEQAGEGVRGSVKQLMADLNAMASDSYGRLRSMEGQSENVSSVPKTLSAVDQRALATRQEASLGFTPDTATLTELRRIRAEMDAMPFTPRLLRRSEMGRGGSLEHVEGTGGAGANVYHDILQFAPGAADMTRAEVLRAIDSAIETGHYTNAAKGALSVAQRRLRGDAGVSSPELPPSAGDQVVPTEPMGMAVDVGAVKPSLKPIYDRLKREGELAPLMGGKADALRALDRLLSGPDYAPLSVADAALGDLKTLARVDIPELRTQGQGIAAEAVKQLDRAVQQAARTAGPDAVQALDSGRGATRAKYQAGDVFEALPGEPVQSFRKLVAPKDSGIQFLRQVQELAPSKMPDVARAYLDDLMMQATERGKFDHADRLYANWQKLGPQTKQILFPDEGHRAALDQFFLLAKRMAENPNPSGTAHTMTATNLATQPAMYALSKMLYTERGVKALTNQWSLKGLVTQLPTSAKVAARVVGGAGRFAAKAGRMTTSERLAAQRRADDEARRQSADGR
jgi:hypothetical protein